MDFFDREARAQKQTRRLVWLFGLTVVVMLLVNNLLLASLIYIFSDPLSNSAWWSPVSIIAATFYLGGEALVYPRHFLKLILHPQIAGWISLGTLSSIAAGCYYKIRQLSAGGPAVAELLGGPKVLPRAEVEKLLEFRTRCGLAARPNGPACPLTLEDAPGAREERFFVTRSELIGLVNEALRTRGTVA